jgi:hypothetical protein
LHNRSVCVKAGQVIIDAILDGTLTAD